ncbi:MAG: TonB-dependent receptor plug domain-containing protein, partial [Deltaproteobacteria bacterium]|nr:TonB-dependent receptor plug domain-containing protein [Deltaproteobacteria bacterium]
MLKPGNPAPANDPWRRRCARAIAALLLALPASAEDPGDPNDPAVDGEEIPISGAPDGEAPPAGMLFRDSALHEMRVQRIAELADYAPNLAIDTDFAATNPTVYIRGFGLKDDSAHPTGPIGVYHDGININSPAIHLSSQTFDLEAVEVLRGPQGSVDAHNASAGAIRFRSARPDGHFGISTNLTYGNYDAKTVEAAIDVPLIEDVLSMRVSGRAQWRDGYTKNQCAGWNPERYGKPDPGEEGTLALYNSLIPLQQWENGQPRRAEVIREKGQPVYNPSSGGSDWFIFLDWDAAREAATTVAQSSIGWGTIKNPSVLNEDLYDENGALVASKGTRVGYMRPNFKIDNVDNACLMKSPGWLSTYESEYLSPGDPTKVNGVWNDDALQPGPEVFRDLKRYTNDVDDWAARMVLLFEPLDNMEWMLNAHGSQNRGDSAHLQMLGARARPDGGFDERLQDGFSENNAAREINQLGGPPLGEGYRNVKGVTDAIVGGGQGGGDPFSGFYDRDGIERVDAWGINGHGLLDLGAVAIRLLYDYEWYDRTIEDEGDATPLRIYPSVRSDSAWQTTADLRAEGEGERYKWTAGFFFLYEEFSANNFFPIIQAFQGNLDFEHELTSLAPYLAGEVDLIEEGAIRGVYALTLSGGVRYNREENEYTLSSRWAGAYSGVTPIQLPEESEKVTWKEWTGDIQLSYTPFANAYGSLLSYLRYGRGFKNGHFNTEITITGGDPEQDIDPVEPGV